MGGGEHLHNLLLFFEGVTCDLRPWWWHGIGLELRSRGHRRADRQTDACCAGSRFNVK